MTPSEESCIILFFRFTSQERLKIIYLIQSVMQENKMRQRHEELRLQREKMTAHMVRKSQTRCNVERIYDPQLLLLFGHLSERNRCPLQILVACSIIFRVRRARANLRRTPISHPIFFFFAIFSPQQNECLEEVTKHEEEVRVFHETYDAVVAEDKVRQRGRTTISFALARTFYKCAQKKVIVCVPQRLLNRTSMQSFLSYRA